jgi:farnesyl-diphosphate farnesyltransferase
MQVMSLERQGQHLEKVSRTFALTIPFLPKILEDWIGNAYLLCRIVDTIEDDPIMTENEKINNLNGFIQCLSSPVNVENWSNALYQKLEKSAKDSELLLIKDIPLVLGRYYQYMPSIQKILRHGVTIMCKGMSEFSRWKNIDSLDEVDHYCYSVAGVVGEILVFLFAEYSPQIKQKIDKLLPLAVSFGEALQLTNILKDVWEDDSRGIHWLPMKDLNSCKRSEFTKKYVEIALGHVQHALNFITEIPRREVGIRTFCLLANCMSLLTLKNIYINPNFVNSKDIKISRSDVKKVVLFSKIVGFSNSMISYLFKHYSGKNLIPFYRDPVELRKKVSYW